jgi:AcrR family transcriptional regulator
VDVDQNAIVGVLEVEDLGLRERKRRETRAALSLAAIRLCMQRGWDAVTVSDIAAAANVSPRTFRNYFSTKAEAVAAGHSERLLRIADGLRERPAREPLWTAIAHAVAAQFETPVPASSDPAAEAHAKRWRERIQFLFNEPAVRAAVLEAGADAQGELAKAVAERTGVRRGKTVYPHLVAATAIAVMGVVSERWLREGPTGSIVTPLRQAFDVVAAGFPEPKRQGR